MAYLHCHSCDFSQDDFWDESYNPMKWLLNWEKDLLSQDLESQFEPTESDKTWRELLAKEFEHKAESVRTMIYRTNEEFNIKNPEGICPKCLKKDLDID